MFWVGVLLVEFFYFFLFFWFLCEVLTLNFGIVRFLLWIVFILVCLFWCFTFVVVESCKLYVKVAQLLVKEKKGLSIRINLPFRFLELFYAFHLLGKRNLALLKFSDSEICYLHEVVDLA